MARLQVASVSVSLITTINEFCLAMFYPSIIVK
ncbi:hypothetical protein PC123_g28006 [Phytophthora cactorum]|nr:hypothetical protein PC123_g28006 [Phytophthora cactorum]